MSSDHTWPPSCRTSAVSITTASAASRKSWRPSFRSRSLWAPWWRWNRRGDQGGAGVDAKAATICTKVVAWDPALWWFARVEGFEPTNHPIERRLGSGVPWRQNAFGNHGEAGCRVPERMLTVVQTPRLQKRPVVDDLPQAKVDPIV
jgi:hypothetical protein